MLRNFGGLLVIIIAILSGGSFYGFITFMALLIIFISMGIYHK